MTTFQGYFRRNTSLKKIDKYIQLVLKTFGADDNVEVTYEDQVEVQLVKVRIFNRVLK